jgi:hypothetical protein
MRAFSRMAARGLWLAGFALLLAAPGLGAKEPGITAGDVAEIRAAIDRQIEALRRDDAKAAFRLASPGAQTAFRSPERFLEVVRMAYRPVYRPASVRYLNVLERAGEVVQQAQITDRSGGVWLAYFAMQRQSDGSWKTDGCLLVQASRTIPAYMERPDVVGQPQA